MTNITAGVVKELRDVTGAGMMKCRKALEETAAEHGADKAQWIEAATDWLRANGHAAAAKKSGRTVADGLVALAGAGEKAILVEVNSETDFVARNPSFQDFVIGVSDVVLASGQTDIEALGGIDFPGTGRNVADELTHQIATIGENMAVRRAEVLSVEKGAVATYMHSKQTDRLGKIGVLVALESEAADKAALDALGRQVAMHIAATNPAALNRAAIDPALVEREKSVLTEQALAEGKPAEIVEKMIVGRLQKFYKEVVLEEQPFVMNPDLTVAAHIEATAKDLGASVKLAGFIRMELGEGIQKEEDDFAAEVSAMASAG